MISFSLSLLALVVGYFVYGKFVDHIFGPDNRETPAVVKADGVDFMVLPSWKILSSEPLWAHGMVLWHIYGLFSAVSLQEPCTIT